MATINVPGDQATLALAYTAASHGDIINLAAGSHSVPAQQNVNLEITIQGATGTASDVTLASNGAYHTLYLQTGSITVKDLTITNPDTTSTGTSMWFAFRSDSSSNNGYVVDNVIVDTNHCGIYGSGSTSTYNRCDISVNNIHGGYRATTGSLDGKGTWTNNRCYGHDVKYWGYMTSAATESCSFILSPTTTYTVFSAIITSDEIYNCSIETDATTPSRGIRATSSHTHVSLNCPNITGDFYTGTVAEANTVTTAMAQASGQNLMVDAAAGDAHVNPLGLSYQNGDYGKISDPDLDGNNYNNPPSRGCYEETPAAGGGPTNSVIKSMGGGFLSSPFTLTP